MDKIKLREIFAEELEKEGERPLAAMVRGGHDNSRGGVAALRAMERAFDLGRASVPVDEALF
jgi:hypothetical protein